MAGLGVWFACLCIVVATVVFLYGWRPGAESSRPRPESNLAPNAASAARVNVRGKVIEVPGIGDQPVVLNLATPAFPASAVGFVAVDTSPLPAGAQLALLWVRSGNPNEIHEQILKIESGRAVPTPLGDNPDWKGEVAHAAIGVKNPSTESILVGEVRLLPFGLRMTLSDMVRDWNYFSGWDGRSINVVFGGREEQRTYLPPLAALAAIGACAILAYRARRRGTRPMLAWIVVPFVASWVLLDLRWQRQLTLQARESHAAFAGKTFAERHAAMEHPAFFALLEEAGKRLPKAPARIFVTSDFEYFRLRAGYYLYPHNVLAFDWADPSILRPGDYLLLFAKSGVSFDDASASLEWSGGRRVPARELIDGRGEGLYEIR